MSTSAEKATRDSSRQQIRSAATTTGSWTSAQWHWTPHQRIDLCRPRSLLRGSEARCRHNKSWP